MTLKKWSDKDGCEFGGYYITVSTYEWNLEPLDSGSKFPWDKKESDLYHEGKAGFLYDPASEDDVECPGETITLFQCDKCNRWKNPYSDDQGKLLCPICDVTGLIFDDNCLDHLEKTRQFARESGVSDRLEEQISRLQRMTQRNPDDGPIDSVMVISKDFAPYSFVWGLYRIPTEVGVHGKLVINGGLIYHAPQSPGDGSFPSLSVSLGDSRLFTPYWSIHT